MIETKIKDDLSLVITTEGSLELAENLAKELIRQGLAACINFQNVKSLFLWEGKLEELNEVQLLIKTTHTKIEVLLMTISQLHSYQTPEIIYWKASASPSYKGWVTGVIGNSHGRI